MKYFLLLFLPFIYSCEQSEVLKEIPQEFKGNFIQTTDEIIVGLEIPIKINIFDRKLYYLTPDPDNRETYITTVYKIEKIIKKSDLKIILWCQDQDFNNSKSYFDLVWDGSYHFLYIEEVFPIGPDYTERVYLGKFHINK